MPETDTFRKIIAYVSEKKEITAKSLIDYLEISPQAVFKQLKSLIDKGILKKIGSPPKVFYSLNTQIPSEKNGVQNKDNLNLIEQNYFIITPRGEILRGMDGFAYWCAKNHLNIAKTAEEYAKTIQKHNIFKKDGLIDGMIKLKQTFPMVYLDELYYLDFYSIERFGKTKLGALLLYAKQSQSKELIKEIYSLIKDKITALIKNKNIDAVGFIPPTVSRKLQFQRELERLLAFDLPIVKIIKATSGVIVPQKTLSKLEDRIENAGGSIFIDEITVYKSILLIDDAVGSGATFNETARKIKEKGLCSGKIVGLAITGSFKGFDVLTEV